MRLRPIFLFVAVSAAACLLSSHLSAHEKAAIIGSQDRPRMEVVFVLDTTGSMSGMIAGAKQKVWAIANKLKSAEPTPAISFGLVGYRDRGDAYVTKAFCLSS